MAKPVIMVGAIVIGILCCTSLFAASKYTKEPWQLTNITGHLPDLQFALIDDQGHAVTERDYQGSIVLLYFGFTGCSSQCPLTMARLSLIMKQLGGGAQNMRILFVSINPGNDTPQVLHHYLASFDPDHMIGLTGSDMRIESLAKRCRAAYRAGAVISGESPHSNVIYIFGKTGHARLIATPEDSDQKIMHDLYRLSHDGV